MYSKIARLATVLAFIVILLGAYTRLSDAGLGCPDWPGCYGKLVVPHNVAALKEAEVAYPATPLETPKAWAEMVHRYFAGTLGLLIIILALWGSARRSKNKTQPLFIPWILVALALFQAALGMWTVTLKLLPDVVSAHLVGGMAIAALLYYLSLATQNKAYTTTLTKSIRPWIKVGLIILILQIFLGAWTSTNYAALACQHFPLCNGSLFPPMEWKTAFNFLSPIGPNYEGGQLDLIARATIQMAHRYGAFITFFYLGLLSLNLMIKTSLNPLRRIGITVFVLLILQIILGVLNVELRLPLQAAVMHNAVALLLLLTLVAAVFQSHQHTGSTQ